MMLEKCCIAMLTSITSSVPALPLIMIRLTTTVNVFNRGELEHRDTFSQRVLSEKPKFMQKKRTTKK